MGSKTKNFFYSPIEERINVATHFLGLAFSVFATVTMILAAISAGGVARVASVSIFGFSLILAYASSTIYHRAKSPETRRKLRILDHVAIYFLIAGTYTPITLVTLRGPDGWTLFIISWSLAAMGTILKIFFTGRFSVFSTILYVAMGWLVVFDIKNLYDHLGVAGFSWLLGGGLAYTAGAVFYATGKIKYNHAIFHVLTLLGSFCHIISIMFYVVYDGAS